MTIKEMQKKSGLTQKNFSILLSIPLRTIESWCSGTRTPPDYVETLVEYYLVHEGVIPMNLCGVGGAVSMKDVQDAFQESLEPQNE